MKPGEQRTITVTFPADYGAADLAGKAASFEVTVKEVRAFEAQPIDDTLAQAVGMENLDELRQAVPEQIERDYEGLARQRLKRALLDKLAERHAFAVPQGMVEIEFEAIWRQYQQEQERQKTRRGRRRRCRREQRGCRARQEEDAVKAEYRAIAERRVRLGLLLAEVGRAQSITVTPEEINRALTERRAASPARSAR